MAVCLFFQLQFFVGGVPNIQEGIVVQQNYTGCVENLYLNSTNFIREVKYAYEAGHTFRFEKINTIYSCPVSQIEISCSKIKVYLKKRKI